VNNSFSGAECSVPASQAPEVRIRLAPHRSLTPRSARWFFASAAAGPLLTGAFCALHGFWPVLPFAGLEIVALAWALWWSMRARNDVQTIVITADEVRIVAREGKIQVTTVFSRHWTRVKLHTPLSTLHPSRLALESRGRECELGRFLTDVERRELAAQLQQLVGSMNESPAF
jgi:uncharacterized membrane protein